MMKALVLRRVGELALCDMPRPVPRAGELLIRTKAATICTSDLNDIRHNPFGIQLPMIMGHEGAGVVVQTGADVKDFSPGDEVISHPVVPCGVCSSCRRGLEHLCEDMEHLGINLGGVFAEYYTIRADRARKKPPELSFAAASLLEPVCVCLQAIRRAGVSEGDAVLVTGDGPFGILTARLLRESGAANIILTGRHDFRMHYAGCKTIHEKRCGDVLAEILRMTGGEGVDSAILCAGAQDAVNTAVAALRARGVLSVFSAVHGTPTLDLFRIHAKELELRGSCNDQGVMDQALAMLTSPQLALEELVTHRLPFVQWQEAFRLAAEGKDEAIKVSLLF